MPERIEIDARPGYRTVGMRISAITADLERISATGKNQQGKQALSVEDVEDALRPLFAKHGVVAWWTITASSKWDEPTSRGTMTLWRLDFEVTLQADNDASDFRSANWFDIGTSPAAAESFAVKGYYRRLFHIASADDENAASPGERRQVEPSQYDDPAPAPRPVTPPADPLEGLPAGFTIEQWTEVKKLARDVKGEIDATAWTESGLNTPARVKAHLLALAASVDGSVSDETRSVYAYETIRGELDALRPTKPATADEGVPAPTSPAASGTRPGAFSYAATGRENPTRLEDEAEALRQAALALGS